MICAICGKEVENASKYRRCFCEECKAKRKEEHDADVREYIRLQNKLRIERAICRIERYEHKQMPFEKYEEAIEVVEEYIENNPNTFDSTEEVMTAILFLSEQVPIKCQQKIAGHIVDFVAKDYKMVLEIDGYMHEQHRTHDAKRDKDVLAELGNGWEVVRIPTQFVNKYPSEVLVDATFEILENQRNARKKGYGGAIKDYYKIYDSIFERYAFD